MALMSSVKLLNMPNEIRLKHIYIIRFASGDSHIAERVSAFNSISGCILIVFYLGSRNNANCTPPLHLQVLMNNLHFYRKSILSQYVKLLSTGISERQIEKCKRECVRHFSDRFVFAKTTKLQNQGSKLGWSRGKHVNDSNFFVSSESKHQVKKHMETDNKLIR